MPDVVYRDLAAFGLPFITSAAVLVNRGSQAVVTFCAISAFVPRAALRFGPHCDSEMLAQPAEASLHHGIRPSDVLPPPSPGGGMGFGSGGPLRNGTPVSLQLDVALFEDGLCAGPDETGLFDAITRGIAGQTRVSREIADLLGGGATAGAAFDLLRPMAGLAGWMGRHALPPRLRLRRPEAPPL